jgi:hypothetical protein
MNDDELRTTVRERFTGVRMDTPVDQIVARGRAVRARRRIPVAAGGLAAAAGVAIGVATLVSGGPHASHATSATLTAWTVQKQANGDVRVTIRDLRDPSGLQARLRADGIPANVSFSGLPAACQPVAVTKSQLSSVVTHQQHGRRMVFVIHPSALPSGDGVFIFDQVSAPPLSSGHQHGPLAFGLVQASSACTG